MVVRTLMPLSRGEALLNMNKKELRPYKNEIYPHLLLHESAETEEILRQYLGIVKRIFENMRKEKPEILTELRRRAKVRKEGARKI